MTMKRARVMDYFDLAYPHAGLSLQQLKDEGKTIVGTYCAFAPLELIYAAGAIPVSLCAAKEEPIAEAEKVLPRNFCPLIKSSFGFAVTQKCPFFMHADVVIGETTCDGKKKMFELMAGMKPLHVLNLPQGYQKEADHEYWQHSVGVFKKYLEEQLGIAITDEALTAAILAHNRECELMQKLAACMSHSPVPLSGQDLLKVLSARNYLFNRGDLCVSLEELIQELQWKNLHNEGVMPKAAKRIVVTGVPTGIGADKVIRIIEEAGAAVVYFENCTGMKPYLTLIDTAKPPLEAIAEKYLHTPCSCLSPNLLRMDLLRTISRDYRADGIIDIVWQGCHTYNVESNLIADFLQDSCNIPLLKIETDYSQGDVEQIRTRVEAFLEMIA